MRTRSLDALTAGIVRLWPGATVWGKGDTAHQASTSDHNEDDTPGSKAEQSDADNVPEHRALDVPKLGPVTMAKLRMLRARLTDRPANRARLRYVILEQTIWRKRNGWVPEHYSGEFHDHLHISQDVADDDNGAPWDIDEQGDEMAIDQDNFDALIWRVEALVEGRETVYAGPRKGESVWVVKKLNELAARPVTVAMSPDDRAAIVAEIAGIVGRVRLELEGDGS